MRKTESLCVTVESGDGRRWNFTGREAWAVRELIRAGEAGCTPIDHPGPRWSAYVFKLRRAGLIIETVRESHRGPFPGNHARYILRTPLHIVESAAA